MVETSRIHIWIAHWPNAETRGSVFSRRKDLATKWHLFPRLYGYFNSYEAYDRGVHCPLISTLEMVSKKVRQSTDVTGISIFKQEIKLSQFVDDTNFFCSDVTSAEKYFEYCKRI